MLRLKKFRFIYGIMVLLTIILGLCSRKFSYILPGFIAPYVGDILWALMVFLLVRFIFISLKTPYVAIIGICFSYIIELSQLYHSPLIDSIRKTTLGGLILGFGFLWSDLVCYLIGILIGVLVDRYIQKTC